MIIAVDGNVYTGKTSTILYAKEKLAAGIIQEYKPILDLGQSSHSDLDIQRRYIDQEKDRLEQLKTLLSPLVFVDRSILSIAANAYAQLHLYQKELREYVLSLLSQRMKKNQILIPDFFVHLKSDYSALLNRYISGEKGAYAKGTCHSLAAEDYCKLIDKFHSSLHKSWMSKAKISIEYTDPAKVIKEIQASLSLNPKPDKSQLFEAIRTALYQ